MNTDYKKICSAPLFFERNRVARVYTGGLLFHDFFGDPAEDGHKPEEWIASSVQALNKDGQEDDGYSFIEGTDIRLDRLIETCPKEILGDRKELGVLVKILDSAVRLPIQAHPDKAFSRKYFSSDYGKTEAWLILKTRPNAKICFGFKDEITVEEFKDAVRRSETDKNAMNPYLNELEAKEGDVYLIPARAVHAIGYGCLILEVQEPTDFTIQPEAWCDEYRLNDYEMYLGLDPDVALSCFDFSICGPDAPNLSIKKPVLLYEKGGVKAEELIGPTDTDCFGLIRYGIHGGALPLTHASAIYIVTSGEGTVSGEEMNRAVNQGDYFMLPAAAQNRYTIEGKLTLVACLPPRK